MNSLTPKMGFQNGLDNHSRVSPLGGKPLVFWGGGGCFHPQTNHGKAPNPIKAADGDAKGVHHGGDSMDVGPEFGRRPGGHAVGEAGHGLNRGLQIT